MIRSLAQVEVKGVDSMRMALNRGFRKVASFIFGNNTSAVSATPSKESVAMTSPVALEVVNGGKSEMVAMTSPVAAEMVDMGGQQVYRWVIDVNKGHVSNLPSTHPHTVSDVWLAGHPLLAPWPIVVLNSIGCAALHPFCYG